MAVMTFAAIDIGSYEVSMKIFEMSKRIGFRELNDVRYSLEIGKGVYSDGKIDSEMLNVLCEVLNDFKRLMQDFGVEEYRACGTSAFRELVNPLLIIEQIYQRTGMKIEILSSAEQHFLGYKSIAAIEKGFKKMIQKGTAILDVGGGAVWLLAQAKSLYQLLTFDAVLQQMSARNSTVLAELDAEASALEQARAAADEAARQAADAKAALEQQQAALADTQTALEAALLDANSTLTAQQAAAQAQAAVTDAAKKAYEDATAALDAYVREQSRRYTTADLHLTSLDFRCPLDSYGRITTQFAEPDPWGIPHRGTDFAAPDGTPIYAIADGVVSAARTMNSYGNCVQVSHGTADDGHRYDSLYAHMSSIAVAQGAAVQKGDLLGYVGNTGNVYGAGGGYHLHLELRVDGSRVDPLGFVPTH